MQKRILNCLLLALFGFFFYTACTSDYIEVPQPPSPTDTVSFSAEIQPIFNDHCVGCHSAGGTSPNLTAGNSYNELISKALVDTITPTNSEIYLRVNPGGPSHPVKNASYAATILGWIEQGAKNN